MCLRGDVLIKFLNAGHSFFTTNHRPNRIYFGRKLRRCTFYKTWCLDAAPHVQERMGKRTMIIPQDLNPLAGPVEGDSLELKAVSLPVTEFPLTVIESR